MCGPISDCTNKAQLEILCVIRGFHIISANGNFLLALLCMMFSCVFVTFSYGVLGQVWYLILSIPDRCLLPYVDVIGALRIYYQ